MDRPTGVLRRKPRRLDLFDEALREHHRARWLAGVDEAGRGPWAGPVVVAAVVLDLGSAPMLRGVRDSKTLSPERRSALFDAVRSCAVSVSVAWAAPQVIDRHNILRATLDAMRRAVIRLGLADSGAGVEAGDGTGRYGPGGVLIVVDGNHPIPEITLPQLPLIRGDAFSLSIASAGIVAKVVRDRWMERLDRRYPGYGFSSHKGYGTAEHLEALNRLGPSPIHRRSFRPVMQALLPLVVR